MLYTTQDYQPEVLPCASLLFLAPVVYDGFAAHQRSDQTDGGADEACGVETSLEFSRPPAPFALRGQFGVVL